MNEIRSLKDDKASQLRKILTNHTGSPILKLIKDNQDALGMDPDVFDLVYEGFWDLYTLKPKINVSAKKLKDEWIKKIKFTAGEQKASEEPAAEAKDPEKAEEDGEDKPAEDGEEAKEEEKEVVDEEDVIESPTAIVVVKVQKVKPDPVQDDEGNDIVVEYNEDQLEELEDVPFEDKYLSFETQKDGDKIWIINRLASKNQLKDIGNEFRQLADKLDSVDSIDFNFRLEKEAQAFEDKFLALFAEDSQSNAPKVPVFSYRPEM